MNKHTPGPWRVEIEDGIPVIWAHPNSYDIAIVAVDWEPVRHQGPEDIDNGTKAANARLIAAAPDLLAALEMLLNETNAGTWDCLPADKARAAIAKAKGE